MELLSDSNIIIIDFLAITEGKRRMAKDLVFEDVIYNTSNGQGYSLVATINQPSQSHNSCCIYEQFDGKIQQQGWWNYDGLKFKANLIKAKNVSDVLNKRPRILFYILLASLFQLTLSLKWKTYL